MAAYFRTTFSRPGFPEIAVGLTTYFLVLSLAVFWMLQIPDDYAALRGNVGMAGNGLAGIIGLLAAFSLRIRDLRAFGFRVVRLRWILIAMGLAVVAFGASFVVEGVYFHFITEANTQGDFQAASAGGALSLLAILITGAILTPIGEELIFRGIIANALNRYGVLAGVVLSAVIFGIAHGPNVIFLLAFMVGIMAGVLLRKTSSIWPGLVLHMTYNGLHLIYYATL